MLCDGRAACGFERPSAVPPPALVGREQASWPTRPRLPALRPGTQRNLPIGSSLSRGALSGFGSAHHPLLSFRSSLAHWSDHPVLGLRVPTSLDGLRAG